MNCNSLPLKSFAASPREQSPKRRCPPSDEEWESCKGEIYQIYVEENKTLTTTMRTMKEKHQLNASERTWKMKLKQWKFSKNRTSGLTTTTNEPLENITYHPPPEYPSNLELLNHFRAVTCYTIHGDPVKQKVWQINVPRIAPSFNFVGHGILAFSALHLAYLDPRPRMKDLYASRALRHHQISLCTAIKNLSHVTDENCSALYSFSILVTLYTIASPRKTEDFLLIGEGEIAPWLAMFRGTNAIMETSKAALMSGPLRPIFTNSQLRMELRESCTNTDSIGVKQLEELQHLIAVTVEDSKELKVYVEAIKELRKSYTAFFLDPDNSGPTDAFTWVHRVSKEYLFQLKEQTQEALCIFAFFCVLLHQRNSLWWYEGWSTHLMRQIGLLLNEEHRWWIRWPVEQVGLVGCLGLETQYKES